MRRVKMGQLPELPYSVEEAVNRLRVNVSFAGNDVRRIMVISTVPDEGKSFVTMHLWRQMAGAGSPSLLLDADMRKSVLLSDYGIEAEDKQPLKGTTHYLASDALELEDVIYHTEIEGGDILPNADNVINPSLLIEGERFEQLLKSASEKYRYVFIDAPPLDLVSDGELIGSHCDGAILVIHAGSTPKRLIRNSVRQLERANCPLLGVVLNRVEASKGGYYGKRYGGKYYGKYYVTEEADKN
ncbi:MAG: CpsD/CapB family tyrosine-protein kinase [Eubacteriales bacterium]|nr:CpsD/CapB family tyrosine-protein kinase [Eubacteriales bacterium]